MVIKVSICSNCDKWLPDTEPNAELTCGKCGGQKNVYTIDFDYKK